MTRPRLAIGLLVLVLVGGTLFAILGRGSGAGGGTSWGKGYRSSLGWSIRYPREMHVEHSGADSWGYGAHETTFATFASSHGVRATITPQTQAIRFVPPRAASGRFPAGGVALRVLYVATHVLVPSRTAATPLPLRLSQFHSVSWYGNPRPLWHFLIANGRSYQVLVWIGKGASTAQRVLVERMLASLSVHPVSGQH